MSDSMLAFHLRVGSSRLLVKTITTVGNVCLEDHEQPSHRLVLLCPGEFLLEDPMVSSCFEVSLGNKGLLWSTRANLPGVVRDLVVPCEVAASWLRDEGTEVTIAAMGPAVPLVVACVLVALGDSPSKAIETVMPGGFDDLDDEIAVSVFAAALEERRAVRGMTQ